MNAVSSLGRHTRAPDNTIRFLRRLMDRLDVYCRYIRAGAEIERLLALSDQQLAARGLRRAALGRTIMERQGIGIG